MKQLAFISEHAPPLATIGSVDVGGQNVYVAELANPILMKKMKTRAVQRVQQQFTWQRIAETMHNLYGTIIAEKPIRPQLISCNEQQILLY